MTDLTRGAVAVREKIVGHLQQTMPPALAHARDVWDLSMEGLPDIVKYDPYETRVTDSYPQLLVNVTRARGFRRTDITPDAAEEYYVRYTCNVILWSIAEEYNNSLAVRDDYATCLRSAILSRPSLNGAGRFRVDESTLEETYSDGIKARGDRFVSGGRVAFELEHVETLWRVPLGSAEQAAIEATVLPRTG